MGPTVNVALPDATPQTGRAASYAFLGTAYTLGALISAWVAAETIPIWPGFRAQYCIGAAVAGMIFLILLISYLEMSPRIPDTITRDRGEGVNAAAEKAGYNRSPRP
jgi:MFS family permease